MDILGLVEDSVIDSIFERGWVEQSPEQFISQCKNYMKTELDGYKSKCSEETINKMIIDCLMRHLGEEFDVNIYRLKFFPAESNQEYDV